MIYLAFPTRTGRTRTGEVRIGSKVRIKGDEESGETRSRKKGGTVTRATREIDRTEKKVEVHMFRVSRKSELGSRWKG